MPHDPTRGDDAPKRRPISKRLRYEILRRDNHACRYCGARAPAVPLVVDHVQPVALGGQTVAENLVAACKDCNSGKSSTSPDAPIVNDVTEDALRWARAMTRAVEIQRCAAGAVEDIVGAFDEHWRTWEPAEPRPFGWENSIGRFAELGLEDFTITAAVDTAMRARVRDTFSYFCGSCWNIYRERQTIAADIIEQGGADGAT